MVFRFLLYCLNLAFKASFSFASFKDASFKKHLKEGRFTMQIKTLDNGHVRYYRLADGKFSSKNRDYPKPDLSIVWSNSSEALSTIFKPSSKDVMRTMSKAVASGKLKMEIKGTNTPWFVSTVFKMMKIYRKMIPFIQTP